MESNLDFALVNIDENSLQQRLKKAFDSRDLEEFSECIASNCDTLHEEYDDKMCIYFKALSTHGCCPYVKVCQQRPADAFQGLEEHAINYAAMSMDARIVELLLPSDWVNEKLNGLTPLNYLAKHVSDHSVEDAISCIMLLLQNDAEPQIPDEHNTTAVGHVLHNLELADSNKRLILERICRYDPIENQALRTELLAKFPDALSSTDYVSVRCGDMERFKRYFFHNPPSPEDNWEHLFVAIRTRQNDFFDFLLENGAEGTAVDSRGRTALDTALTSLNRYALKILLEQKVPQFSGEFSIIDTFMMHLDKVFNKLTSSEDFFACLDLLLQFGRFDINQIDDDEDTMLSYSYHMDERTTMELLKRGAFVGTKDSDGDIVMAGMQPKVLEKFFDGLITSNDSERAMRIYMDYRPLIPPPNCPAKCAGQMEIIEYIANNEDCKYLIRHPLIATFLFYRWDDHGFLFYMNFWLYVFFSISTVSYMLLIMSNIERGTTTLCVMSWLGLVYLLLRECLQLLVAWRKYLRSVTNYLELLIITLAILFCSNVRFDRQTEKILAVVTILLITVELFHFLGSLPLLSMSTRMHMFQVVCASFLKNFLLYSVFVVAFSLCFYIMFGLEADANGGFNEFTNPLTAFLKTTVMMIGELDAGSMKFDTSFGYIIFFMFLFVVTIVLYNLLNGTAIRDILEIEGQALLNEAVYRAKLICRYNRMFGDDMLLRTSVTKIEVRTADSSLIVALELDDKPKKRARIGRNKLPKSKEHEEIMDDIDKETVKELVKEARHILKERKDNSKRHEPINQIEQRLENVLHEQTNRIEKSLENILNRFESRLSAMADRYESL